MIGSSPSSPAAPWPRPTRCGGRSVDPTARPRSRWFYRRAAAAATTPPTRRTHLGGAQGLRLLRVLQGPRRGVRAADLPVGLAQGAPPGGLPRRGAHPRPRHVPQAADPRRRPPVRHRDPRRSTSTPPTTSTASSGSSHRRCDEPAARRSWTRLPRRGADVHGLPDGRATASGSPWPRSRASPTPRSRGSSPASPTTLADFWHRAQVSRPVVERLVVAGASTPSTASARAGLGRAPVRRRGRVTRRDLLLQVAELDRWTRSVDRAPAGRLASAHHGRAADGLGRPCPVASGGSRRHRATSDVPGARRPRQSRARPPPVGTPASARARRQLDPRPRRHPRADRGHRAARDDRGRAGAGRARRARPRRQPARPRLLRPDAATRSG